MTSKLGLLLRLAVIRPRFAIGYLIVITMTLLAIFAPVIAPYSPTEADSASFLQPPSAAHLFGTDNVGMDIFSRSIYAPRIDLTIAVLGTLLSAVVGSSIGALSASTAGAASRVAVVAIMQGGRHAEPFRLFSPSLITSLGKHPDGGSGDRLRQRSVTCA